MLLVFIRFGEEMSYLVSARRYRPQSFEELVGQDHVANTLKNAITKERVGHAYLFSGPRGIGKTSAARIFAKALNCEKGPTGSPCGVCTFCREITEGRSLDLIEIDGASNRRIDEVRQLRENVRFVPSSSRYKIYIIDEVHMLTPEAFNALLKTLEEPPEHVIFIFATTELQKVPQTIRSRCQQFVFKRIPIPLIIGVLERITRDLKVEVDERALFWIARCASGSMRDAESILDQMISYADGPITPEDVFYVLGLPGYDVYHRFAGHVAQEDFDACYRLFDDLIGKGMEVNVFISGLLEYFKNLFVLSIDTGAGDLIDLPAEDVEEMRTLLGSYGRSDIGNILVILQRVYLDARNSELSRELFEIALIKMVHFREIVQPALLVERLEGLRAELVSGREASSGSGAATAAKREDTVPGGNPGIPESGSIGGKPPSNSPSPTADADADTDSRRGTDTAALSDADVAEQVIRHFSRKRRALAEFLGRAKSFTLENNLLTIRYGANEKLSFEHVHESSAKRYIEKEIRGFLQKEIRLNVTIEGEDENDDAKETLSEDVNRVMKIFKGEIVQTGE